jgi:hypothetical protein
MVFISDMGRNDVAFPLGLRVNQAHSGGGYLLVTLA